MTIYGTDTTGIHGEPYNRVISTVAAKRTYVADSSIPWDRVWHWDPGWRWGRERATASPV